MGRIPPVETMTPKEEPVRRRIRSPREEPWESSFNNRLSREYTKILFYLNNIKLALVLIKRSTGFTYTKTLFSSASYLLLIFGVITVYL